MVSDREEPVAHKPRDGTEDRQASCLWRAGGGGEQPAEG
jgi:hypothetical protein